MLQTKAMMMTKVIFMEMMTASWILLIRNRTSLPTESTVLAMWIIMAM
jgi:hypothetical protein